MILQNVLKSTNGTLNVVLALVLALAAAFGFPEASVESFAAELIAFVGIAREWLKGGPKLRWNMNVYTYIGAALLLLLPWADALIPALGKLIEAITTKSLDKILPAFLALFNIVYHIIRDKAWNPQPAPPTT